MEENNYMVQACTLCAGIDWGKGQKRRREKKENEAQEK
jgi:hypothetical protein